jgi:hypothetical protein
MMGWSGERAGPQRRATCSDVRMRRPFSSSTVCLCRLSIFNRVNQLC